MSNLIDLIIQEKLGTFKKEVKRILSEKKEKARELERLTVAESIYPHMIEESDEVDDSYEEEEPNMDVDLEPEIYDENDMDDLEASIWEDVDDEDLDEDWDYEDLDEEIEQVDELSKKTLGNYVKKASTKMGLDGLGIGAASATGRKDDRSEKSFSKRTKGIAKAVDKLAK